MLYLLPRRYRIYWAFIFSCKVASDFWKHVLSWLRGNGIQINTLKETDLIFGKFDNTDDFILINHMLLLGKFYLYSSRCQKSGLPNLSAFIARTKRIYNIEHHIARENNELFQHLKKWEKLFLYFNNVFVVTLEISYSIRI